MATRETRADRGRREGRELIHRLIAELRLARVQANLSQRAVADALGWSAARYGRFEREATHGPSVVDVAAVAALLGLKLTASVVRGADGLRDAGQLAVAARFRSLLSDAWQVVAEVLLPNPGDPRSWDLGLRLGAQRVGVEIESRIRDIQRLTRHVRARERDGGMDQVLIVLADTRHNRQYVDELREMLGSRFDTPPRDILDALRNGKPLPGSGVILV